MGLYEFALETLILMGMVLSNPEVREQVKNLYDLLVSELDIVILSSGYGWG